MIKKNEKNQATGLKTLRLLVEVVETESGFNYIVRTENGMPIAQSDNQSSFLKDLEEITTDFANFNPSNNE